MIPAVETSHEARALFRLTPNLWGKPRIAALLAIYCRQLQSLEDAIWSIINGFDVDSAERWALEVMASIVGETRRPASDDALRTLVKGRIAVNRSSGLPSDLKTLCDLLFASVSQVIENTLSVTILVDDPGTADMPYAARVIDEGLQATVSTALLTQGTFVLPGLDLVAPAGTSLPDLDLTGGGIWSDRHVPA